MASEVFAMEYLVMELYLGYIEDSYNPIRRQTSLIQKGQKI